jgi:hypothetical protein
MGREQGDQMSLCKNRPTYFLSKLIHNLYFGKSKIYSIYVIKKKLPKVNISKFGKNSPNLVTLVMRSNPARV